MVRSSYSASPEVRPPAPSHQASLELVLSDSHKQDCRYSQFAYLDDTINYEKNPPNLQAVPELQQTFQKVYDKYDIALTNRQKIDETLRNFKDVLQVDRQLQMSQCFERWRSLLTDPVYTVTYTKENLVKAISVRAREHPKPLWAAQKHIRELLEACHLYVEQYNWLENAILEGLGEVKRVSRDVDQLVVRLNVSDRRYLRERVFQLCAEYDEIPGLLSMYKDQVEVLLREIRDSAFILLNASY